MPLRPITTPHADASKGPSVTVHRMFNYTQFKDEDRTEPESEMFFTQENAQEVHDVIPPERQAEYIRSGTLSIDGFDLSKYPQREVDE